LLSKEGIEVEVIDPRSLYPLDKETIFKSVQKTNKVVIVTEENKRGGYGGEISALISENYFDYLDAPIIRLGALDTPIPFSPKLESYVIPNETDIVNAVKKMI
jgi:pyruvate dehydrogenase E1 component beta subunit